MSSCLISTRPFYFGCDLTINATPWMYSNHGHHQRYVTRHSILHYTLVPIPLLTLPLHLIPTAATSFTHPQSSRPHKPPPHTDVPFPKPSPSPSTSPTGKPQTYRFNASTLLLMTSCPTHKTSTFISGTLSNTPTVPMFGTAPSFGMNWLVPGVSKQTWVYLPPG